MKANLPVEVGITLNKSNIRYILEYASPVWGGLPTYLINEIERTQTRFLRVLGPPPPLVITMTVYKASLIEEKNF